MDAWGCPSSSSAEDGDDARPLVGHPGNVVFMVLETVPCCLPAAPLKMEMRPNNKPAVAMSSWCGRQCRATPRPPAGDEDDAGLHAGCPDGVFLALEMAPRCLPAAPPKLEMTPGRLSAVPTLSS